jgi:hypothetical protein
MSAGLCPSDRSGGQEDVSAAGPPRADEVDADNRARRERFDLYTTPTCFQASLTAFASALLEP